MQSKWAGVLPQPHLDLAGGIALWRPAGPSSGSAYSSWKLFMRAHVAAIEHEHAYTITAREALRWAIVDECPGLVTPTELTEKSLALYRQALLRFHRMSKQTRYVVVKAVPQRPGAL